MRPSRGFSLIEIIVSIFIIGVMLVLLQAVARNTTVVRTAKNEGIALAIARNELETLRQAGYTSVPTSGSFSDGLLSSLPQGATATLTSSDFNTKTKQVTVTVVWKDPVLTASSTVTLTTLITQTGGLP